MIRRHIKCTPNTITVSRKMNFTNKIALITGASSGIGAAAAILFAKEGANVVLVGRNEEKLQKVSEDCAKTGNEPLSIKADVTNEEDAKRIVAETIEKFGRIDVLVNNAGIARFCSILSDNIMEVYDSVMNINLRAHVHITHLAAPHLIKTKGNIINISSASGKLALKPKLITCYATSKAGLDHFTRNVAAELAPYGVRVNIISPGPVRTDVLNNAGVEMVIDDIEEFVLLGRISEPEEIADLILFLASDKAKAITGSDFVSDNGALVK